MQKLNSLIEICLVFCGNLAWDVGWVFWETRLALSFTRQSPLSFFGGLRHVKLIFSLLLIKNDILQDIIALIRLSTNIRAPLVRILIVFARSRAIWTGYTATQILLYIKLTPLDFVKRLNHLRLCLHLRDGISVRKLIIMVSIAELLDEMLFGRPSILRIALVFLQQLMVLVPWFEVIFVDTSCLNLKIVLLVILVRRRCLPGLLGQTGLFGMMSWLAIRDHCCGLIERFHGKNKI